MTRTHFPELRGLERERPKSRCSTRRRTHCTLYPQRAARIQNFRSETEGRKSSIVGCIEGTWLQYACSNRARSRARSRPRGHRARERGKGASTKKEFSLEKEGANNARSRDLIARNDWPFENKAYISRESTWTKKERIIQQRPCFNALSKKENWLERDEST